MVVAVIGAGYARSRSRTSSGETYGAAVADPVCPGLQRDIRRRGGQRSAPVPVRIVIEQKTADRYHLVDALEPDGGGGAMTLRLDCNLHPGQTQPPTPGTRSMVLPGGSAGGGGRRPTLAPGRSPSSWCRSADAAANGQRRTIASSSGQRPGRARPRVAVTQQCRCRPSRIWLTNLPAATSICPLIPGQVADQVGVSGAT